MEADVEATSLKKASSQQKPSSSIKKQPTKATGLTKKMMTFSDKNKKTKRDMIAKADRI